MFARALSGGGTPYEVRRDLIRDSRESLLVYEEKGMLKGLVVELAFIPVFQRAIILHLIEKTRKHSRGRTW